ncbi:hypothetical protein [Acidaminobacter hydrogenoformans]|uniref:Uncharacterized protein n=1 Tax=Acidaminobacter hydrogenoformans DSM 2784 TaxID=1120920 RepID=A0A1G5S4X7_9FIRM|nr:hypothetical protein [Acidaminobacter hydrogenoformans]SCZ81376.1 hypothetical protein SAMN03080599_02758 [Acidaminobacter hydrogenoformans DSM 2784]
MNNENNANTNNINTSTSTNNTPSPSTPRYKRVQGGNSWASAMFRFTADSLTYASRLTANLDRYHFGHQNHLTTETAADGHAITLYCRGIQITQLTPEDIEILRATAAYAFEDHLIEKLRSKSIPEAFKIPLKREKGQCGQQSPSSSELE